MVPHRETLVFSGGKEGRSDFGGGSRDLGESTGLEIGGSHIPGTLTDPSNSMHLPSDPEKSKIAS